MEQSEKSSPIENNYKIVLPQYASKKVAPEDLEIQIDNKGYKEQKQFEILYFNNMVF